MRGGTCRPANTPTRGNVLCLRSLCRVWVVSKWHEFILTGLLSIFTLAHTREPSVGRTGLRWAWLAQDGTSGALSLQPAAGGKSLVSIKAQSHFLLFRTQWPRTSVANVCSSLDRILREPPSALSDTIKCTLQSCLSGTECPCLSKIPMLTPDPKVMVSGARPLGGSEAMRVEPPR